jgi:hypothetical protein
VKRVFTHCAVSEDNAYAYAGSSSGDVLQFAIEGGRFVQASTHRFSLGITALTVIGDAVLAGTGDGALVRLGARDLALKKAAELLGGVTSIAIATDGASAFVGTDGGNI